MNYLTKFTPNKHTINFLLSRTNLNRNFFQNSNLRYGTESALQNPVNLTVQNNQKILENEQELDELFKKVVVHVRGHDPAVLESYENFVRLTAKELELNLKEVRTPYRFIERWTLLKAKFSKRKHMRQYEMRTHFKEFEFVHLTGSTCDTLLEYIQRNLPEGVAMHVHQTKLLELSDLIKISE